MGLLKNIYYLCIS